MAEIRLEGLSKRFGDFAAVRSSTLTVGDGQFVVLLGPSGCGKTTTLRMIAGLEVPTGGRILLGGEDVTCRRARERDIAFVFQLFALYPHMSVRKNLAFPLVTQGVPRAEVARRVGETARLLRIEGLLDRRPGTLASGDRQRVALGRAIIRRPKAFLLDEPLGALDSTLREAMREELRRLHDDIGATTVYVTHDQVEAMSMGDLVVVMNKGEILQAAAPEEIYARPATMFVGAFIGSPAMNFLPNGDGRTVLGVRPEHVRIGQGGLRGRVFGVEYMGAHQVVTVETEKARVRVRTTDRRGVAVGDLVGLDLDPAHVLRFDSVTERACG